MHRPAAGQRRTIGIAAVSLALAAAIGGCGSGSSSTVSQLASAAPAHPRATRGPGVPASSAAVIEAWADALRTGRGRKAASYWAHPAAFINGTDAPGHLALVEIDSEHDALLVDDSLPCGATLRSATRNGPYIQANFDLGLRTGRGASTSGCSGPARVEFLIRSGHIARWLRAPTPGPAAPQISVGSSARAA